MSLELNGARVAHELARPRLTSMPTMELWEKPMIAAIMVKSKELKMEMVPVVKEYQDVFPEELPGLLPMREV